MTPQQILDMTPVQFAEFLDKQPENDRHDEAIAPCKPSSGARGLFQGEQE